MSQQTKKSVNKCTHTKKSRNTDKGGGEADLRRNKFTFGTRKKGYLRGKLTGAIFCQGRNLPEEGLQGAPSPSDRIGARRNSSDKENCLGEGLGSPWKA